MKLIITESQYRMIVENEDKNENLLDLTGVYESGVSPNKWDDIFLLLKEKKERKGNKTYDGYYINGNVDLQKSEVIELKYLVKVEGNLDLRRSLIKSLPMLSYVWGDLNLYDSQIESLPMLEYVGGYLNLHYTPLSNKTTEEELRKQINVGGDINL